MKSKLEIRPHYLILIIYAFVFVYLIFQDAIYSPDTYSYLRAMPHRHPGYVIFVKFFKFLFGNYFDISVVIFQLVLGLFSVHFVLNKFSSLLKLNLVIKMILLIILLFPFFAPLSVANNICAEGLSYPLYLLFVGLVINILFNSSNKAILYLIPVYLLLVLTRGQFIITPLIIAFLYILKHKSKLLKKPILVTAIILISLPFIAFIGDNSYHKLKDGIFMTTPFSFVNASSSAFYVSKDSDVNLIKNPDYKIIFKHTYDSLSEQNLLLSSTKRASYSEYYNHFHNNIPSICNHTIHYIGREYYLEKNAFYDNNSQRAYAQSSLDVEVALKNIVPILIKSNFKKWIKLYYANLGHAFYSKLVLFFMLIVFLIATQKIVTSYRSDYAILFLLSALTLSNALLITFASHSILRYLFYNYALIFLIPMTIYNIIKHGRKN